MFTKMQEVTNDKVNSPVEETSATSKTDDLSQAIDAEIKALNQN